MAKTNKDKYIKIIDGNYWARITYVDQYGKRRELKRRADNKTHAKQLVQKLLLEIEQYGTRSFDKAQMTFEQLIQYYQDKYLVAPKYVDGRKVAGLRGYKKSAFAIEALKEYFGKKKIRSITSGDLEGYKLTRLNTPTQRGKKQRSLATVHRELALLSRVMGVAHREGWINRNPFHATDKLISVAEEKKRDRVLTREEEKLLLEQCVGIRKHLKPIIICALDTGMRSGEMFSLKWKDVDLDKEIITIEALNTKTLQTRQVALSFRLAEELEKLFNLAKSPEDLIFGIASAKRAFATARTDAKLTDLRFHDLRHTAATRLIQQGIPLQEVGRILGHTQANTTYRYVNANTDTARRAADALNQFHAQKPPEEKKVEKKDEQKEELIN